MTTTSAIQVKIGEKHYQISCPAGNEAALIDAARQLDQKLANAATQDNQADYGQLLTMIALNLTHEVNQLKQAFASYRFQTEEKVEQVKQTVGQAQVD